MHSPPPGHDLLAGARSLLLEELLPELPPEQEWKLRVIADAMQVAERELRDSADSLARELKLLSALYEETPPSLLAPAEVEGWLRRLNARLVRDIRTGALDRRKAGRLRRVLLDQVISRLRIVSPAYLRVSGYG